jgi:hypothetical protein
MANGPDRKRYYLDAWGRRQPEKAVTGSRGQTS